MIRLFVFVLSLLSISSWGDVPNAINVSGVIVFSDSSQLVTGSELIRFTIYDNSGSMTEYMENGGEHTDPTGSGASVVWTEVQAVPLSDGRYSVVLGADSENSLPVDSFANRTQTLGITVADDEEMSPRMSLYSVPFARRASVSDNVSGLITPSAITIKDSDGNLIPVISEEGEWLGLELIGLQGETGLQGPIGEKGVIGEKGLKGDAGPQGDAGQQGEIGEQGLKGDKGGIGLQGIAGPQGPVGVQGLKGERGLLGPIGEKGLKGDMGSQGNTGPQGLRGLKGDKGDTGDQGIQGTRGLAGLKGGTGPKGEKGEKGDSSGFSFYGLVPKLYRGTSSTAYDFPYGGVEPISISAGEIVLISEKGYLFSLSGGRVNRSKDLYFTSSSCLGSVSYVLANYHRQGSVFSSAYYVSKYKRFYRHFARTTKGSTILDSSKTFKGRVRIDTLSSSPVCESININSDDLGPMYGAYTHTDATSSKNSFENTTGIDLTYWAASSTYMVEFE